LVVVDGFAYLATTGAIKKVDLSTGTTTTFSGSSAVPAAAGCTANADPASARYGILRDIDTDGTSLFVTDTSCGVWKVSLVTGGSQLLVPLSFDIDDLTFAPDGFLYGGTHSNETRIRRIDPATGGVTIPTVPTELTEIRNLSSIVADEEDPWVVGAWEQASPEGQLRGWPPREPQGLTRHRESPAELGDDPVRRG
jgi:hypothetical protein